MSPISLVLLPLIPLSGVALTVAVVRAIFGPGWAA